MGRLTPRPLAALCAGLLSWPAAAAPDTFLEKTGALAASYPEGPIAIEGRLYVAEMTADRVIEAGATDTRTFWHEDGCGPTSLAPLEDGRVVVLCHIGGYLAVVSSAGITEARVTADEDGRPIRSPNDSFADGKGGVYLSDSGPFGADAPAEGSVLRLAPDLRARRLVTGLHYANGVAVVDAGRRLLVSEHLAGRVLSFAIAADGTLAAAGVLADRALLESAAGPLSGTTGPDGIEPAGDGSVLVCIYGAGAVVRLSLRGELLGAATVSTRYVTNVSRWKSGYAITGAFSNRDYPYAGEIGFYGPRDGSAAASPAAP
jgi:sugar lactone lactonase YvrE